MITDLQEIADGSTLDFDLCIIGAGAAGIALAMEHSESSIKVCLLEAGGFDFEPEVQEVYEGATSGIEYLPLESVRLRYFGGTTNRWAGQSTPLDSLDFETRDWVESSGWPISYAEFAGYLTRAQAICRLGASDFAWETWKGHPCLPQFPLESSGFEPVVLRFPEPVTRFGEDYRVNVETASDVLCLLHASVLRLETNEAGTRVTVAKVAGPGNRRINIQARFFVVATGGIENSRLLLLSGPVGSHGLGNEKDQVGRHFMEHPNFDASEVVLNNIAAVPFLAQPLFSAGAHRFRLDVKLSSTTQAAGKILNHSAFLIAAEPPQQRMKTHPSRVWNEVDRPLDFQSEKRFKLRVRLESPPRYGSRVKLSAERDSFGLPRADVHMTLGEQERETIAAVHKAFAREIGRAAMGRMRIDVDAIEQISSKDLGWQSHHCGGTRMSSSPNTGVVDENCRIHGIDNVYVAGSSVFPTSGHANPTLNLLALTLRLSDHLKKKLSK